MPLESSKSHILRLLHEEKISSTSNYKTVTTEGNSDKIQSRKSVFFPTTKRPILRLNITRDPFITDEYSGKYNEKWGFSKKSNYRGKPKWWTRPPFHVTRGMFSPPRDFQQPPGPTKLFWPGIRVYKRLGPLLPKSTYPPVWFRTGATNRPYTLPPQQPMELKTEIVVIPQFQDIDTFDLGTDPTPTVRFRTGKTNFPYSVHPFVKKALWGKVKPEDRESFTYPSKWIFDENVDFDFLIRSEEATEQYKSLEERAATAWMDSSLFSETALERPDKGKKSKEYLHKSEPTYPPVWIRTGKTNFPHTVKKFIKKDLWGKVKPEDRESFTKPAWMLDYDEFLAAEFDPEEITTHAPTTSRPLAVSTFHTSPWWTYPAYWLRRYPHLNVTERITTPELSTEEAPAEWTRPTDVAGLSYEEGVETLSTTTRRSFVLDILEKRKNGSSANEKKGVYKTRKNIVHTPSQERPGFFNDYMRHDNPQYGDHYQPAPPVYGNDYYRPEPRDYYPRDRKPRYNNDYPRHLRERPRYDVRNPSYNNDVPRFGRGSRFSRSNRRFSRNQSFGKDNPGVRFGGQGHKEGEYVTQRKRFRYRPKRSLDEELFPFLTFDKSNGFEISQEKDKFPKIWGDQIKTKRATFRPKYGFYTKPKKTKIDFEYHRKIDALLQQQQAESSSSGSGSISLATLIRSFESDEEKHSDVSSDEFNVTIPTRFKWVERKWAGFVSDKNEMDLSEIKEPTTYFPKPKNRKVQMRRELRTKAPKVFKVPFKRTVLRRTTPPDDFQRRKRNIYDDMNDETTERDKHFEAWLKSKREEEERERLLFDYEFGLTTPDYLNEPIRSPKAVRRRARRGSKVTWVAKTKRPKVIVVPFTLPERLSKIAITLKGRSHSGGRKKKGEPTEAPQAKTPPTTTETTEKPGYFKFGKRIYWLTPKTTFRPTWLRPRRLKPLTTTSTTELPSPKYATLINIYRTTERPTIATRRKRINKARTFRTLKKLIVTKSPSSESDDIDSEDIDDDDDDDVFDDDEPPVRTFPTLKVVKRKKQEVISFREYLQRRENLIREREETMWNAQFEPESEELSTVETTTMTTVTPVPNQIRFRAQPTFPTIQTSTSQILSTTMKPTLANNDEPTTVLDMTTQSSTVLQKTRKPYRSRKPRSTGRSRGTRSTRSRARRIPENMNIFPTLPSSDSGRTKRELLFSNKELVEVTTKETPKTMDPVLDALNKQKIALEEEFFQMYLEKPTVETTTFEYNIDNLCHAYNVDYGKTSRSLYLENLCKVKNTTSRTPLPLMNSYSSSSSENNDNSSDNIVKRSIRDDSRIELSPRMRSVSKPIRRIPIEINFNSSEFSGRKHPNFELYNARRSNWFNNTFLPGSRINLTQNYAYNQFRRGHWRPKQPFRNVSTYNPDFSRYFKSKQLWFNRTNDMHLESNPIVRRTDTEKQRWMMRNTLRELHSNKSWSSISRFQKQKAKLKELHSIPNFSERDIIKQRHRWGDKEYIPWIDKYTAQRVLHQPENPDESIEERERQVIRNLNLHKLIPVAMPLLDEVSDPDLLDQEEYLENRRYQPPKGFEELYLNINDTYDHDFRLKTHRDINMLNNKHSYRVKEAEKRKKNREYRMELYTANGDYRKYPNLNAMKQRRVISLLDEPVEDDSEYEDFLMTTPHPVTNRSVISSFEKFIDAHLNVTTEATKVKLIDQYNRTYIHDTKLNITYYPTPKRHVIPFSENYTNIETYDKYINERHNYYNYSLDISFTHYVFSSMRHDNITCTYGRMSNVINRWYNKTYYPYYRPSIYRQKYNIAMDRNYLQLMENLEKINNHYQNKLKNMNFGTQNVTSEIGKVGFSKEIIDIEEKTEQTTKEFVEKVTEVEEDVTIKVQQIPTTLIVKEEQTTKQFVEKVTEVEEDIDTVKKFSTEFVPEEKTTLRFVEKKLTEMEEVVVTVKYREIPTTVSVEEVTTQESFTDKITVKEEPVETTTSVGVAAEIPKKDKEEEIKVTSAEAVKVNITEKEKATTEMYSFEDEKEIDEIVELHSAETMRKKLMEQKAIRQKEYMELLKRTTTTPTTTTHSTAKPSFLFDDDLFSETSTKPTTTEMLTTEITTTKKITTIKRVTSTRKKITTTAESVTTAGYPDYKLTKEPTKPTKKPVSFFNKLIKKIKPLKIIKSWFSWGKTKTEKTE